MNNGGRRAPAVEIVAASRTQDGGSANEDAYGAGRNPVPHAVLCDGSGAADQVGRRAVGLFMTLAAESSPEEFGRFQTWENWARILDSSLLGGPQSTFLAVAALGESMVGTCVGDSRLYLFPREGEIRILTEEAVKFRLGSGRVTPHPIHQRVSSGDTLLLMSDGAWTPLNLARMRSLRTRFHGRHVSDIPSLILDEAGRSGRADDMTVVALRVQ
jgi:hypothetical protein